VFFRGHVQGVGFRWSTETIASRYPITGYVENMRDGSVHLVAEGMRHTVSSFIQSVLSAQGGTISDHSVAWQPATGEFHGFTIRRHP